MIRVSFSHVTFIVLPKMYGNGISDVIQNSSPFWNMTHNITLLALQTHFVVSGHPIHICLSSSQESELDFTELGGGQQKKWGGWEGKAEPRHAFLIHNSWDNTGPASGKANTLHTHTHLDHTIRRHNKHSLSRSDTETSRAMYVCVCVSAGYRKTSAIWLKKWC